MFEVYEVAAFHKVNAVAENKQNKEMAPDGKVG